MAMILTSPDVVAPAGSPLPDLVAVLRAASAANNPVGIISNSPQPAWFAASFAQSGVQFLQVRGRQNGNIVSHNAKNLGLPAYDTVVLAGKMEDVEMGKNGRAVLVGAGWAADATVKKLGIQIATAADLHEALQMIATWSGKWWYERNGANYSVKALCDLSRMGRVSMPQVAFAKKVTNLVKNGGPRLWAVLTCAARSLLIDGFASPKKTMWGVYPSASSKNNDTDVLSDFTHRLRTTVTRVHFAKRGKPLFIRHRHATKRSTAGGSINRIDPKNQLATIHLNPEYRGKVRGRHVVVVDDCTTYGLSFGVAAALLRSAGAASITGVALGKFGNQLHEFDIAVTGDPFAPLAMSGYKVNAPPMRTTGTTDSAAQSTLIHLLP